MDFQFSEEGTNNTNNVIITEESLTVNETDNYNTVTSFEPEIETGEPTLKAMFNIQHINDEGHAKPWAMEYLILDEFHLTIKESPDDRITRGIINLHDVVEIERYKTGETPEDRYVLRIMVRSKTQYIIVLDSYSTLQEWTRRMERKKGIMRESDINPPPPVKYTAKNHSSYTFRTFIENRKMFGEMWMVYGFIAYTIILAVLFAVLWTVYVVPFRDITQIQTQCYVYASESEYVWRKNYDLKYQVTYMVGDERMDTTIHLPCGGSSCPDKLDNYPVNGVSICYYDKDDVDFVFFTLQPYVVKRYQVTFGVCGGLLGPWLIVVVTLLLVRRKTVGKMIKNSCC